MGNDNLKNLKGAKPSINELRYFQKGLLNNNISFHSQFYRVSQHCHLLFATCRFNAYLNSKQITEREKKLKKRTKQNPKQKRNKTMQGIYLHARMCARKRTRTHSTNYLLIESWKNATFPLIIADIKSSPLESRGDHHI